MTSTVFLSFYLNFCDFASVPVVLPFKGGGIVLSLPGQNMVFCG